MKLQFDVAKLSAPVEGVLPGESGVEPEPGFVYDVSSIITYNCGMTPPMVVELDASFPPAFGHEQICTDEQDGAEERRWGEGSRRARQHWRKQNP